MPLPLAAIATAATAAGMEYLRQRNLAGGNGTGPQVGKLVIGGTAVRASTAALLGSPAMNLVGPAPSQVPTTTTGGGIPAAIARVLGGGGAGRTPGGLSNPMSGPMGGVNRGVNLIQEFLVTGGVRRKYRRMNITNVKALRRAGRRLTGFVKLAKSMVQLEQRARIKKRRRR